MIFGRGSGECSLLTVPRPDEINGIASLPLPPPRRANKMPRRRRGFLQEIYLVQLAEIQFAEIKVNIRAEIPYR